MTKGVKMWTENQNCLIISFSSMQILGKKDCDICTMICLKKEIHKNYRSFYVLSMGTDL